MIRYKNLLSPIKVGNLVLKNRFVASNSLPHFLQGPEPYPAESVIDHIVSCARNGAAIVTIGDLTDPEQRHSFGEDLKRFPMFALDSDPSVENYISQLADQVHYYNSRISLALMPFLADDPTKDVCDIPAFDMKSKTFFRDIQGYDPVGIMARGGRAAKQFTHEQIHGLVEKYAQRVRKYQKLGFDLCTLHFAYRATLFSRFLSPQTNHRTDEYGGSVENRARFLLELCARIKELCGKDFPIEVQITAREEHGTTLEETIRLAGLAEGLVDIFQFRADTANLNHPTGFNSAAHVYQTLEDCAAVKASGTRILCEPIGGFQDVEDAEEMIAAGKADLIGAARAFIADSHFYEKVKEGRGANVVPCIRCNKCHGISLSGPWVSLCSVNPEIGIAHKLDKLTKPVTRQKRVAVVGGGPAGMRAALFCAERGHMVTLFEKTDRLGGQLKLMDYPSFKWLLKNYREYLIAQLADSAVEVRLNTQATPKLVEAEDYDALILALGAVPQLPAIPSTENCWDIFSVFGNEHRLGKRCVVIGGSESGCEAAMYLAENGHDTTVLTRGKRLAPEATPIHYREIMEEAYHGLSGFHFVTNAITTEIGEGYVTYRDQAGTLCRIECDSVVALGGMRPLQQEAMAFYGLVSDTYMIGDCREVGNLHMCNRGAYSAAHQI